VPRLKHKGTLARVGEVERAFDPYVHVTLRVGVPIGTIMSPPPFYWCLIDPKFSLVEIPIDRETGRVAGMTIPLCNGRIRPVEPNARPAARQQPGVPTVDLALWSGTLRSGRDAYETADEYHNETGRCRLELRGTDLRVELYGDDIQYCVRSADAILWEFNESAELCAVTMLGLTQAEVASLNSGFVVP